VSDEKRPATDDSDLGLVEGRRLGWMTIVAAAMIIVLAMGSLLWPRLRDMGQSHVLLVFDSSGDESRVKGAFGHLGSYLSTISGQDLEVVVATTTADFMVRAERQPDFVFAPDGLAMRLSLTEFVPLMVGRRRAPYNLRPRSVLVYRRSEGGGDQPWQSAPQATVFGDSVSLTALASLEHGLGDPWPANLAVGPDP